MKELVWAAKEKNDFKGEKRLKKRSRSFGISSFFCVNRNEFGCLVVSRNFTSFAPGKGKATRQRKAEKINLRKKYWG